MEARSLKAAPQLLTRVRPALHLEVGDEIADDLTTLLSDCGYVLHDGEKSDHPRVSRATWCTIATPREKPWGG